MNDVINYLRQIAAFGQWPERLIDLDALRPVECKPCPDTLLEDVNVEFKGCYNNSFNFVEQNFDSHYVIGYALSVIPMEHAWVWHDGVYYDPTWEKFSKISDIYVPLFEFTYTELWDIIRANDMAPPSVFDMLIMGREADVRVSQEHRRP